MSAEIISRVWPEWQVQEVLGKGSYGTVYKAVRSDDILSSTAAIKVISVPMDQSEVDSVRSQGVSEENTRTYFQRIVNDFVSEIRLMDSLKGTQNIVSVEDYRVIERTNEIGWDILIRMELLTPFNTYIRDKRMTEAEVLKLGIDICSALEICEQRHIIHRDIKPENIFINDFGYFKLGDFGIARTLENATGGMSQKGTYNYMAPEVAMSHDYDVRVDLYSLGIVLYRLLNRNFLPFIENEQQLLNPNARKAAVDRRLRGDVMPPPCEASAQAAAVILQACAYSPQARFASAGVMKRALQQVANGSYVMADVDLDKTVAVRHAAVNVDATVGVNTSWNGQPQGKVPQVQGWQQVKPPVQTPVAPVQTTTPPVYTAPVQTTTAPVYTAPVQNTTPPVYTAPVQTTTPPVYTAPVQNTTPPVYTAPVQNTTPPVYTAPAQTTTPPVYTAPAQTTTPPAHTPPTPPAAAPQQESAASVNTAPAAPQPKAKKPVSSACFASMILGGVGLLFTEDASGIAIVLGGLAMLLALIGKLGLAKKRLGGMGFGLTGIILGTLSMSDGLGYAYAAGYTVNSFGYYNNENFSWDDFYVGIGIGAVVLLIFLVIGRKKKEG